MTSSSLGTLLIQRLDAVLGIGLAQQGQMATTRSDAVTQPSDAVRTQAPFQHPGRPASEHADLPPAGDGRAVRQLDSHEAPGLPPRSSSLPDAAGTPSAPTSLGAAARSILALLTRYPDAQPMPAARTPLLDLPATSAPASAMQTAPGRATTAPGIPRSSDGALPTGQPPATTGISSAPPAGTALAAGFARALALALQHSGLFYESHLAAAVQGRIPLAEAARSPQAHLAGPAAAEALPDAPSEGGASSRAASSEPLARAASLPAQASAATLPAADHPAGLHPDTHLLVRQQLEVLAGQALHWRGLAWPGVPLEWELERNPPQTHADTIAAADTDHWATRLALTLPRLGQVEARLLLRGTQLMVQVQAPESADVLARHGDALRAQMLEAGLFLSQLSIQTRADGQATGSDHGA